MKTKVLEPSRSFYSLTLERKLRILNSMVSKSINNIVVFRVDMFKNNVGEELEALVRILNLVSQTPSNAIIKASYYWDNSKTITKFLVWLPIIKFAMFKCQADGYHFSLNGRIM